MKAKGILAALALLVGAPAPAAADGGAFKDPDEKPFCEAPDPCPDTDYMDFRRVTFGHGDRPRVLRHGIETRKRWKTKELGGRNGVTIYFQLNTDDDARAERVLRVRRKDGELWGRVFRGKYYRKEVGRAHVWRPDRRSLKVRFHRRLLGEGVARYRWSVHWSNRDTACPGSCHVDFAPHRGWYEHRL